MKIIKYTLCSVALIVACADAKSPDPDVIINTSIEFSGGEKFKHSVIDFDFRDRHYSARRDQGYFLLTRTTIVDSDTIVDALDSHDTFSRNINNIKVELPDTMAVKYKASVNAVHYFSVLPYRLNDPAVNKAYMGKSKIKDAEYHKIRVTFNADGGGEDHEDVFIYWINTDSFKADYIAYSYTEPDGTGYRFREAFNERYIDGIRFVDYNNYKPQTKDVNLESLGQLFAQNELALLSKIELKNINVKSL
ncbi:DUF6503 family protein [Aestuariivivens sediminicola]|uniref:DUF6503 family protein n=1 Tax=Aestuariivivens sediminicola TaxID=2913560 RepID=UPI001F59BC69|nr:DUF6503 family protein [Aestuariivivens sediminicola]